MPCLPCLFELQLFVGLSRRPTSQPSESLWLDQRNAWSNSMAWMDPSALWKKIGFTHARCPFFPCQNKWVWLKIKQGGGANRRFGFPGFHLPGLAPFCDNSGFLNSPQPNLLVFRKGPCWDIRDGELPRPRPRQLGGAGFRLPELRCPVHLLGGKSWHPVLVG